MTVVLLLFKFEDKKKHYDESKSQWSVQRGITHNIQVLYNASTTDLFRHTMLFAKFNYASKF